MLNDNLIEEIRNAYKTIYSICQKTPLEESISLSNMLKCRVFLKNEFMQSTGSFKLRGATYKILKLVDIKANEYKIVTASTGNHGSAVSYASKQIQRIYRDKKINCIVYVPNNVDKSKQSLMESNEAIIRKIKTNNSLDGEIEAKQFVLNNSDSIYISPYNDLEIIAGQGTIGVEISEQLQSEPDAIFVSIGGGGLISGIAKYIKSIFPNCKIIGCQPNNSRVIYESLRVGKILSDVPEVETFSDGTAGGVEENALTFPLIQQYVDDIILATEKEIADAFCLLIDREKKIVEGSAALTLACLIKTQENWKDKNIVLLLCGNNISLEKMKKMLNYR